MVFASELRIVSSIESYKQCKEIHQI